MPLYLFYLCDAHGVASSFEARELKDDAEAFSMAGELLDDHRTCEHIDVLDGERPVAARHRNQPTLRPVEDYRRPLSSSSTWPRRL